MVLLLWFVDNSFLGIGQSLKVMIENMERSMRSGGGELKLKLFWCKEMAVVFGNTNRLGSPVHNPPHRGGSMNPFGSVTRPNGDTSLLFWGFKKYCKCK